MLINGLRSTTLRNLLMIVKLLECVEMFCQNCAPKYMIDKGYFSEIVILRSCMAFCQ